MSYARYYSFAACILALVLVCGCTTTTGTVTGVVKPIGQSAGTDVILVREDAASQVRQIRASTNPADVKTTLQPHTAAFMTVGADGRYEFANVPAGKYLVFAQTKFEMGNFLTYGSWMLPVTVAASDRYSVDLEEANLTTKEHRTR